MYVYSYIHLYAYLHLYIFKHKNLHIYTHIYIRITKQVDPQWLARRQQGGPSAKDTSLLYTPDPLGKDICNPHPLNP
jgi:hypothetical protein